MSQDLQKTIESAWKNRINLAALSSSAEIREAINDVINRLDQGTLRIADKVNDKWVIHQWVKQALLLSFQIEENLAIPIGMSNQPAMNFHHLSNKFAAGSQIASARKDLRIVQPVLVNRGTFIGKDVVLMPSFIHIGAYVDDHAVIENWTTIGAFSQIGKNVHLSNNVSIGNNTDPVHSAPTIIENNCFIGAHSEITGGVIIEENSVISTGVHINQSTRIYDRKNDSILYGRIPSGSIVIPGTLPSENGKYNLYCAVIVKRIDEKTRQKTTINDLLREI